MRTQIPSIRESAEELHDLMQAESRKRLKSRIQALWLLKSGRANTREAAADAIGIHRHTVSRWLAKYEQGGLEEMLTIRTRPNRKRVVPDDIMQRLEQELRLAPEQFSSYADVQNWLSAFFDLEVKYKTIYRLIKYEMGISLGASTNAKAATVVAEDSAASEPGLSGATESTALEPEEDSTDQLDIVEDQESEDVITEMNERPAIVVQTDEGRQDRSPAKPGWAHSQRPTTGPPSLANVFRSAVQYIVGSGATAIETATTVQALGSVVDAAPPFGAVGTRAFVYLPGGAGRKMQRCRADVRRALRRLQTRLSLNRADVTEAVSTLSNLAEKLDHAYPDIARRSTTARKSDRIEFPKPDESEKGLRGYVVYAEEDDITFKIIERQLEKTGIETYRAMGCDEVKSLLASTPCDALVLNTSLADGSGIELLKELRERDAFDAMPILMLGWSGEPDDESSSLRLGADVFVYKPFSPTEFTSRIVSLLRVKLSRARVDRPAESRMRGPVHRSRETS